VGLLLRLDHCRREAWLGELRGRDERGHEGAGPGLERLGDALRKDRVQRGAEQPRACIGVRVPHVEDQLAHGSPAEHFVRLLGSKPERVPFSGVRGVMAARVEAYSYSFNRPAIGRWLMARRPRSQNRVTRTRARTSGSPSGSLRKQPAAIVTAGGTPDPTGSR
jgi:hypothetical protein